MTWNSLTSLDYSWVTHPAYLRGHMIGHAGFRWPIRLEENADGPIQVSCDHWWGHSGEEVQGEAAEVPIVTKPTVAEMG